MKQLLENWRFLDGDAIGAQAVDFDDSHWTPVTVPHDAQILRVRRQDAPQGFSQGYYPRPGVFWYRTKVTLPDVREKTVRLHLDGLMQHARVFVNGQALSGVRPYGYLPVDLDISGACAKEKEITLAVRLDTTDGGDRWYSGAGMTRSAYLEILPQMHLAPYGLAVTPQVDLTDSTTLITVRAKWENAGAPIMALAEIAVTAPQGQTRRYDMPIYSDGLDAGAAEKTFLLDDIALWSPEKPQLYTLDFTLAGQTTTVRFGLRTARFDKDKGFFLNDAPVKLRGVNLHHDGGELFGAWCPKALWARRLKALKEIGVNTIRLSHNPHDPVLYDLMDEMGFLAVGEYIDKWGRSESYQGEIFRNWHEQDLPLMIARDYNHPCIILWSIGNEVEKQFADETFYDTAKELIDLARKSDPTRAVSFALAPFTQPGYDDFAPMQNKIDAAARVSKMADVLMMNYSESFYQILHDANIEAPILGSEIYMLYRSKDGQFRQIERESPLDDIEKFDFVCGGLIWAGCDYLGECDWPAKYWTGAPLDANGFLKLRAQYVKAKWTKAPMVFACVLDDGERWDYAKNRWGFLQMRRKWRYAYKDRFMEVVVMTNCDHVEAYLNHDAVRVDSPKNHRDGMAHFLLPYAPGEVKFVGKNARGETLAVDFLRTAQTPHLSLRAPEAAKPGELVPIEVWLLDEFGTPWQISEENLTVSVSGGELVGLTSGHFEDDGAQIDSCTLYHGHALLWARMQESALHITALCAGTMAQAGVQTIQGENP